MARVAIVPTGEMEQRGLPAALSSLFPCHDFISVPASPCSSFTSDASGTASLPQQRLPKPSVAERLVQQAAFACAGGRRGGAADFAIIIDDLEVPNLEQPDVVVDHMRQAARHHVDRIREIDRISAEETAGILKDRVSFHLASPMIEAWLLADPGGAKRAGAHPRLLPPQLEPHCDPEFLRIVDACFLHDEGGYLPDNVKPAWLKKSNVRPHHAKAYLSWLCLDPEVRGATRYQESGTGAAALGGLNWPAVFPDATPRMPFLSALINDLSAALGVQPQGLPPTLTGAQLTCISRRPREHVLRNL